MREAKCAQNFSPVPADFTEFAASVDLLGLTLPLVRALEYIKHRRRLRISDANDLQLDRKEGKRILRMFVQPPYCGQMGFIETGRDPNDDLGVQTGQIGEHLPRC